VNINISANPSASTHLSLDSLAATGVWVPALTPINADLYPDAHRYVTHVKWLLEQGCHGIVVFGSTGEANSFSVDERRALLEALLEAGIPASKLMAGTGCCALTDSVTLTSHAAVNGCDKVLVLPPFYYKAVSDEGIYRHYAEIIERVGDPKLKILLYHFPKLSGVPISLDLIERLLGSYPDNIAGIKDSSGDWNNTRALLARFPGMAVFPGTETFLLDGLENGAAGCISATVNVNANAIRNVYDGYLQQSSHTAEQQAQINSVRRVIEKTPLVPTLKKIIARMRQDPEWLRMRPPFVTHAPELTDAELTELTDAGFVLPGAHTA